MSRAQAAVLNKAPEMRPAGDRTPWAGEPRGRPGLGLPSLFLVRKAWGWETGSKHRVTPVTSRESSLVIGSTEERGARFLQIHPELLQVGGRSGAPTTQMRRLGSPWGGEETGAPCISRLAQCSAFGWLTLRWCLLHARHCPSATLDSSNAQLLREKEYVRGHTLQGVEGEVEPRLPGCRARLHRSGGCFPGAFFHAPDSHGRLA